MSVLTGIDPAESKATGVLFRRLLERQQTEIGSRVPWSIAELNLEDEDLNVLVRWLTSGARTAIVLAEASSWGSHLDPERRYHDPIVTGLLLHALYAEFVRRHGSEGSYWGSIRKLDWSDVNDSRLFHPNGQPTPFHRAVLERTAQELHLRNAFGLEGTQQWFSTGYLQFGFTRKGFNHRLPEWLSYPGHATSAIEALTAEPDLMSDSFLSVWQSLRGFRNGNLTEPQTRNKLSASPWILDEWLDELIKAARRRMHLSPSSGSADTFDRMVAFLSPPRLVFDGYHQPGFETGISHLADFDLPSDSYRLMIAGKERAAIHRDSHGDLLCNTLAPIRLPWTTQQTTAQLEETNSFRIAESQSLTCWLADEWIQVFNADGTRMEDAYSLSGSYSGGWHLLCPVSLELRVGRVLSQWTAPDQSWRIMTIDGSEDAALSLEGEIIWTLAEARQQGREQADLLSGVDLRVETLRENATRTNVHLFLPDGCALRWARTARQEVGWTTNNLIASIEVTQEHLERGIQFTLGLVANGKLCRKHVRRPIPFEGVAWFRGTRCTRGTISVLNAWEGRASRVRISPRRENEAEDPSHFVVTEGPKLVRRLREGPLTLGHLSGLGAPLNVWRNQYNESEPVLELAHAVIDGGLIHHVTIDAEKIHLHPAPGSFLRDDFQCCAWVGSQEVPMRLEKLSLACEKDEEWETWTAPNEYAHQSVNSIGIFFEGTCIGSWWNLNRWTLALPQCPDHVAADEYAKIIRVFRSPIRYRRIRNYIGDFLKRFPGEILSTWLSQETDVVLAADYRGITDLTDRADWIRATGILFERREIPLSIEDASQILEEFAPNLSTRNPESQLIDSVSELSNASPLLASAVLKTWLTDFALESLGRGRTREIRDEIACILRPSDARLEDFCRNVIRADDYFVIHHCEAFANSWPYLPLDQKRNISALFEHDVTRKLATSERIQRIIL